LPLVSYGSSSLIVTLAAMGLLLNVASGGTAHVRAVAPSQRQRSRAVARGASASTWAGGRVADTPPRESARWSRERSAEEDRDSGGGTGRARDAGARGGRRAAR